MAAKRRLPLALSAYFALWTAYFAAIWSRAVVVEKSGEIFAGHPYLWGDWAVHFTMGSSMAYRHLFLSESPLLFGAPFKYPFLANLISAALLRLGLPFFNAFTIPSFVFSVALVFALYFLYKTLFASSKVAVVASLIFLFNGGLGFVEFIKDVVASPHSLDTLLNPPRMYTRMDDLNIVWISVINSMVIPQRAFQIGFPLALAALGLGYARRTLLAGLGAGLLFGLLPIAHSHSFLAVSLIFLFWGTADLLFSETPRARAAHFKHWARVLVAGALVAAPFILIFLRGPSVFSIRWMPGWYANEKHIGWLFFWWINWGVTPAAAIAGLAAFIWRQPSVRARYKQALTFLPFFLLFALVNLCLLQQWIWDNTKLLVWASLGLSGLAGYFLWFLFQQRSAITKAAAVLFFVLMTASGAADAYRALIPKLNRNRMYTAEDVLLAQWAIKQTDKDSIWLTGHNHNHWAFNLAGRRALMTYEGWLWTHGYAYKQIKSDVQSMFLDPGTELLYKKYGVDYIVLGPEEKGTLKANPDYFDRVFTLVRKTENYQVYTARRRGRLSG